MAAVELILLQRVDKLGQMVDAAKVKPGYARTLLLPAEEGAARLARENRAKFDIQRCPACKRRTSSAAQEAANRIAERAHRPVRRLLLRQAGESG